MNHGEHGELGEKVSRSRGRPPTTGPY